MEPKRTSSYRLSKKSTEWLRTLAIVGLGSLFLHFLFRTTLSEPVPARALSSDSVEEGKIMVYDLNNLKSTPSLSDNKETVLVLTPMAKFYDGYWKNLLALSYPHQNIELGFIVSDDAAGDKVLSQLVPAVQEVQKSEQRFARVQILRQDTPSPSSQKESDRHAFEFQKERRRLQSLARNSLLFTTIGPRTSWILWLDADVVETPNTLIQDMAKHDKDVLVANCWQRFTNDAGQSDVRPYDYNSWVDSAAAAKIAKTMKPDEILLEGYAEMATYRTLMAHLHKKGNDPNTLIELDGVGATALLVKADVHRDGAMFPPFAFYHLIESEGFAKMAKRLGYSVWGLPDYLVYHFNE